MPGLRGHKPFVIEDFKGLWRRGDPESAPSDHFTEAINVQYFQSGVETRDPLDKYMTSNIGNVTRVYDYVTPTGQSLLVLVSGGGIYHIKNGAIVGAGPILLIPTTMEDFGFVAIAGNAYITPFKTYTDPQGVNYELGLQNEFVYVYRGDGVPARKAAGFPPVISGAPAPFLAYNSIADGQVTAGIHAIIVTFNDGQRGQLNANYAFISASKYEIYRIVNATGFKQIQLDNIPIGPLGTVSRNIYMSKVIPIETFYTDIQISGIFYRALDINDNITTGGKINVPDSSLTVPYSPGVSVAPNTKALYVAIPHYNPGFSEPGFHLIGVVYETNTGYLTAPGPQHFGGQTFVDSSKGVYVTSIPISPDPSVTKRHLVSTKAIANYNGDEKGYQFFFIPGGNIDDNTTTEKFVSYYDSDLLADASHLSDNFSEIPAGVNLNTYHSRLVIVGEYGTTESLAPLTVRARRRSIKVSPSLDNRSIARLSAPGEPEAISKVDGLIIAQLDGNPLTNCQEFRDVLYLFKKTRTFAYSDNQDEPATWGEEVVDQGVGAPVHGIATVLDSGGVNTDFLLIADLSGLVIFNGIYARPELSWKIEDIWRALDKNKFSRIQTVNDSLNKKVWLTFPPPNSNLVMHMDYGDGMDANNIRWAIWQFNEDIQGMCLIETSKLIMVSNFGIFFINKTKSIFCDSLYTGDVKIPDPAIRTALLGD